jgi:hypothetical protein
MAMMIYVMEGILMETQNCKSGRRFTIPEKKGPPPLFRVHALKTINILLKTIEEL